MDNKQVVDADEMVGKISAAAAARIDPNFVLITRTDARSAGADVLFVEALEGIDEIERVAREFSEVPLLFNWVAGAIRIALFTRGPFSGRCVNQNATVGRKSRGMARWGKTQWRWFSDSGSCWWQRLLVLQRCWRWAHCSHNRRVLNR